jgi:hypothetical protein
MRTFFLAAIIAVASQGVAAAQVGVKFPLFVASGRPECSTTNVGSRVCTQMLLNRRDYCYWIGTFAAEPNTPIVSVTPYLFRGEHSCERRAAR